MESATVKHEGTAVQMAGRTWIVPPLSLGQVRRLQPNIDRLGATDAALSVMDDGIELILAALTRNYPELTKRELADEMLDLGNFRQVIDAVMGMSGLTQKGEARAEVSHSAGATSTPTS